ncbi:MAG: 50S ribosomal protein L11 methyltransferase, partial [Nitrospirota bacterium]
MTESDYYDISIATNIDTGNLVSLLDDDTLLGSWDQDGTVHLYWPVQAWGENKLNNLTQLLQQLSENSEAFTIEISKCPAENWNARWAAVVKPIRIGQRIMIRPSWYAAKPVPEAIEIILDPKQAFGTGHHATTQLLLEWLEEVISREQRVLDVGTGSGILAMVALKLGASFALGIDHDPIAIACAREYARVNNFAENLQLHVQDLADLHK